jgi:glutamine synthetase
MMNETRPDKRWTGDAYKSEDEIPQGLYDALDLFDEAKAMHEILGPEFARVYSIVKRTEYNEFLQVISPWEREHLLLNV